jgi:YHS domain-containing protein
MMRRAKDPVCGVIVDTGAAAGGRVVHGSEEMYFCSDRCRQSFETEPGRFVPERHDQPVEGRSK